MSFVLDLAVLLILIGTIIFGYRRGFIQTMMQFIVWVASFALALFLSLPIANAVFDGFMADGIESGLSESLQGTALLNSADRLEALLEELPEPISSVLENNDGLREALSEVDGTATAETLAQTIMDEAVRPVTVLLLRFAVFLILFIVLLFVLRFVKKLVKPLSDLPLIRQVDSILGAILGAAKGCIYVLALVSAIQIIAAMSASDAVLSQQTVEDSRIVSWISDINPITNLF